MENVAEGNLPDQLSALFPKPNRDCGKHQWYNADDLVDHCYHCTVGIRPHVDPIRGDGGI